jgi:hypothetical protein
MRLPRKALEEKPMANASTLLRRVSLAALLAWIAWAPAFSTEPTPEEELAEGKYRYLSQVAPDNRLVSRWTGLAAAMPDWKEKNKAAHYRFPADKEGKKCDQRDCHPGFRDAFVARLAALPEGADRQAAREPRHGLDRCGDCHTYRAIREKTPACSLHYDRPDRVHCTGCHAQGSKVLISLGAKKTVTVRDHDPRAAWPTHQLTKDEKVIACDKACHVPENPFDVPRVCPDCHGKGKLEIASYTAPGVLKHATDQASLFPPLTSTFFIVLTSTVLGALFIYIIIEILRAREAADR